MALAYPEILFGGGQIEQRVNFMNYIYIMICIYIYIGGVGASYPLESMYAIIHIERGLCKGRPAAARELYVSYSQVGYLCHHFFYIVPIHTHLFLLFLSLQ